MDRSLTENIMPYICLANANIPGGTLQITDLWPNESQRNGAIDPPGQNRYLNRPVNDNIGLSGAGPISVEGLTTSAGKPVLEGLGAYLADVVDPGGAQFATGTVQSSGPLVGDTLTFTGPGGVLTQAFTAVENFATGTATMLAPVAGVAAITLGGVPFDCVEDFATGTIQSTGTAAADTVTIAGVVFLAVNGGAVAANQEFNDEASSGSAINTAASLVTAINDAASQALLTAALDALVAVPTSGTLTAANGGTDTVTLTPSVAGVWGDASLAESTAGARIVISGVAMTHTDPVAANQEFGSAAHYEGSASVPGAVATSLAAAINDGATTGAMDAVNVGGPFPALNGHMTAVANATVNGVVDLTASELGWQGLLTLATTDGVNLAISGATLGDIAADPANFEFDSFINSATGDDIGVATSLAATLNNAATDAALLAIGGSAVTAVSGGTDTVTITADTAGSTGAMPIAPSSAVRTVVSANALAKTMVTWTAVQINLAVAAVQALVDAGLPCTAADLDAAINGVAGVSGISVATGNSSVADILSILAGRVYQFPAGTVKDPTGVNWDTTPVGGFTDANIVFDTGMLGGEWGATTSGTKWIKTSGGNSKPVFSGGDTVNNEIGGVRTTMDSTHFQSSLQTGQLAHYAAGISLFPDADVHAFVSDWTRRTNRQATLNNQRVVTVYDDDGSVLA